MKEKVGRYQVLQQIGRGGMGVVYLAEDPVLGRRVAIKTVELSGDDPDKRAFLLDRLIRDGRAAAGLSHPHVVSVYDVLEEGDCGYLVMEYVEGESLAACLRRTRRPDRGFLLRLLREMASALDYTHARGIVHRDIKPANVMLDPSGAAKIMDFGIARIASSTTRTATGMVMGTLEYMSPEQIMGQAVDGRADQFSLAAMAYEMISGDSIFQTESFATLTYKIVHETPPLLRTRVPEVPAGVEEVVARALRKQPEERFPTCGAFAAALEGAFAGEVPASGKMTQAFEAATVATPRPVAEAVPPPVVAPKSGGRGLLVGVAGVAGAVVIGAGLLYWKPWVTPAAPVTPPLAAVTSPAVATPKPVPEKPKSAPVPAAAAVTPPGPGADADADASEAAAQPEARSAFSQGEAAARAGRFADAVALYSKAIATHPNFIKARFARGLAYQRWNRYQDAIDDYNAILRQNPANPAALAQRGVCETHLDNDTAAQADFDKALAIRNDVPAAYLGRGLVEMHRKEYARAIDEFSQAIHWNPDFAAAYRGRGNAYRAMGNVAAANADLKKSDELDARHGK